MTIVETRPITGGVDTHLDTHVAAALDANGGVLGIESFATTPQGFRALHGWLAGFGPVARVGVEGTGAYGAGLARHLRGEGLEVIEVDRPNRQLRRILGKSDTVDAVEAARAVLSGRARGVAKTADGNVEAMRALLIAKRSGREARITCLNQLRHLGFCAPDELRERFRGRAPRPARRRRRRPAPAHWERLRHLRHQAGHAHPRSTRAHPRRGQQRPRRHPRRARRCHRRHGCSSSTASGSTPRPSCWSPPATMPNGSGPKQPGRTCVVSHHYPPPPAR